MVVKFVLISDSHNRHKGVEVPDGDILACAGDFSLQGTVSETKAFLHWFNSQPHPFKVFISGNHDWLGQRDPAMFKMLREEYPYLIYLEDQGIEIMGVKLWGSPWQPEFCGWAYNLPRGKSLAEKWALIPEDTDVLITHGPPAYILDYVPYDRVNVGCEELIKRVRELPNLKLHVFGHIHFMGGKTHQEGKVTFVNASVVDESYVVTNKPIVIDIEV